MLNEKVEQNHVIEWERNKAVPMSMTVTEMRDVAVRCDRILCRG